MNVFNNYFADLTVFPGELEEILFDLDATWLNGSKSLNVTFFLEVESTMGPSNDTMYLGPWMVFTNNNATLSSSDTSKSKKIGEGVGIPIGFLAFLAIVAGIAFFLWRKRKLNKGYGTGKSFPQRTGTNGGASRGHARQASFHDEPTRGVELQDRNKGLTGEDNWGWGSPVSSPTSARHSNAFRDEISRQQTGKAM